MHWSDRIHRFGQVLSGKEYAKSAILIEALWLVLLPRSHSQRTFGIHFRSSSKFTGVDATSSKTTLNVQVLAHGNTAYALPYNPPPCHNLLGSGQNLIFCKAKLSLSTYLSYLFNRRNHCTLLQNVPLLQASLCGSSSGMTLGKRIAYKASVWLWSILTQRTQCLNQHNLNTSLLQEIKRKTQHISRETR